MAKFKIPVEYRVCGEIEVEANTLEEAVEYAKENIDEMPLLDNPQYIDSSYEINDDICLIEYLNGKE